MSIMTYMLNAAGNTTAHHGFHYNPWITVLVPIAIGMIYIGYRGLKVNPRGWSNRAYFLMSLAVALWIAGEIMQDIAIGMHWGHPMNPVPGNSMIFIALEMKFFPIAAIGPMFLYFVLEYMGYIKKKYRPYVQTIILLLIIIDWIAIIYILISGANWMHTNLYFDGYKLNTEDHGWWYFSYHVPMNYITLIIGYFVLIYKIIKPEYKLQRSQALLLFIGSLIALFLNVIININDPTVNWKDRVDFTLLGFSFTIVIYAYAMVKYSMFRVMPVVEEASETEKEYSLEKGKVYLTASDTGMRIASDQAHHGIPTLIFTTRDIEEVREKYGLKETPVFRLAHTMGKDTLDPDVPEHMEMIPFIISDFLDETENGLIFLDNLDEIIDDERYGMFLSIVGGFVSEEKRGILLIATKEEKYDMVKSILTVEEI